MWRTIWITSPFIFYFWHGKVYARHVGLITTKHLGTFKSVVFMFCNAFLQCKKHEQQWQGFLWPPISKSLCCILVYFRSVPGDGWVAVVTAIVMVKTCVLFVFKKKKKDTSWYPALTPCWYLGWDFSFALRCLKALGWAGHCALYLDRQMEKNVK